MPTSSNSPYPHPHSATHIVGERGIEDAFIEKLRSLKYTYRPDINDRATLELNFRQKFEALNRVRLTDGESSASRPSSTNTPICPPRPPPTSTAYCLSSLDDLIAAQADKLEALKTHKKGRMQQLFTTPEEVGG